MMYPYVKYSDGTEVVFSDVYTDDTGKECIDVHFERPTENGFDSVRITLPKYEIHVWEGNYSEEEIEFFKKIVENSADLFYKYSKEGGLKFA
ncbi:MAG: hypothetical protein K2H53_02960 [Clostridia bacterium]|nr:hypothetical protein [Clostridia bacterium]